MTRTQKRVTQFLILAAVVVAWISFTRSEMRKLIPPEEARTFDEFLVVMPRPDLFQLFQHENETFLVATGPLPSGLTLPSGPPSYVFNRKRKLVDWSSDTGEHPSYMKRWNSFEKANEISLQEAQSFFSTEDD